ncbi:MAG: hypothetical protein K2Q23_08585 [Bryobacteraceae bacterium]|nr:hypothetical protein [Bryobacteraceae bacterium]
MPFEQAFPRPFQAISIQSYAPPVSGVYGISNGRDWLYIGETPNIRDALFHHLHDAAGPLHEQKPRGFVFEVVAQAQREERRRRLVLDHHPICNWPG